MNSPSSRPRQPDPYELILALAQRDQRLLVLETEMRKLRYRNEHLEAENERLRGVITRLEEEKRKVWREYMAFVGGDGRGVLGQV